MIPCYYMIFNKTFKEKKMSFDEQDITLVGTKQKNRTWRVGIESTFNSVFDMVFHREHVIYTENPVELIKQDRNRTVRRRLPDIVDDTVTLPDGTTLSAMQVAIAIEMFSDKYTLEDIAAEEAAAAAKPSVQ